MCKCQQNFLCSTCGFLFVCVAVCLCLLTVKDRVSLYIPHWLRTCSVDKAVLQLSEICLLCLLMVGIKGGLYSTRHTVVFEIEKL